MTSVLVWCASGTTVSEMAQLVLKDHADFAESAEEAEELIRAVLARLLAAGDVE